MIIMYAVSCAVSFLLIIAYIAMFHKKDVWFILTFISLFICNTGYFTLSISKSLGEALLANRISYLGSVFLPFFLLMTIMRICKRKPPHYFAFILCIVNTAILFITESAGYSDIYYKSVSFDVIDGAGTLIKEYGPLHYLYYAYLIAYFAAMVWFIVGSFFKARVVSYKHAVPLAIAVFLNVGIYFVERLMGSPYEMLSMSYIITELFLMSIYKSLEDYDVERVLHSTIEIDCMGISLFDLNNNFKGCNDDAMLVFPQLGSLKMDYPIPEHEETLKGVILPVLAGGEDSQKMTYAHDGMIYRIIAKPFRRRGSRNGRLLGTAIIIDNDTSQQEYLRLISSYNERLKDEVAQKTEHLVRMHNQLIMSMADMVEGRDPNTGGHIKRTSSVVAIFADKLSETGYAGLSDEFLQNLVKAAPMHDLGKIAIDDAILRKPGKYTDDEYRIMQTHAEKGAEIVGRILRRKDNEDFYDIAVNVAHYHHERYDGTGYPAHLGGEDIPTESRIMALADVFDALVSSRCYKEKYSYENAFEIIRDSLGKHFDPELGEIFLSCKDELIAYYETQNET